MSNTTTPATVTPKKTHEQDIGALWAKQSQAGTTYFTGSIRIGGKETKIVVFGNSFKDTENKPDYRIYLAKEKGAVATTSAAKPVASKPMVKKPAAPVVADEFDSNEAGQDEI